MEVVIAGMVVTTATLTLGITVAVRTIVENRRRHSSPEPRDDQLRAGTSNEPDARTAAARANGSTAWMRPDGGGF
jgi:hypothetical protein